jgi:hypothetical protein
MHPIYKQILTKKGENTQSHGHSITWVNFKVKNIRNNTVAKPILTPISVLKELSFI